MQCLAMVAVGFLVHHFILFLCFIFMFPFLFVIVMFKQRHHVIVLHIKQHFWMWLLWSSFGFVFFYVPITFVSNYSPGSATWQLTIICGLLLAPFFYEYIQYEHNMSRKRSKSENVFHGVH